MSGEEVLDADEDKRAVMFWISLVLKAVRRIFDILGVEAWKPRMSH